jgi:hypothetical protein
VAAAAAAEGAVGLALAAAAEESLEESWQETQHAVYFVPRPLRPLWVEHNRFLIGPMYKLAGSYVLWPYLADDMAAASTVLCVAGLCRGMVPSPESSQNHRHVHGPPPRNFYKTTVMGMGCAVCCWTVLCVAVCYWAVTQNVSALSLWR